jgi:hypothetical protein
VAQVHHWVRPATVEVDGNADQGQVREGLREVPQDLAAWPSAGRAAQNSAAMPGTD